MHACVRVCGGGRVRGCGCACARERARVWACVCVCVCDLVIVARNTAPSCASRQVDNRINQLALARITIYVMSIAVDTSTMSISVKNPPCERLPVAE